MSIARKHLTVVFCPKAGITIDSMVQKTFSTEIDMETWHNVKDQLTSASYRFTGRGQVLFIEFTFPIDASLRSLYDRVHEKVGAQF